MQDRVSGTVHSRDTISFPRYDLVPKLLADHVCSCATGSRPTLPHQALEDPTSALSMAKVRARHPCIRWHLPIGHRQPCKYPISSSCSASVGIFGHYQAFWRSRWNCTKPKMTGIGTRAAADSRAGAGSDGTEILLQDES